MRKLRIPAALFLSLCLFAPSGASSEETAGASAVVQGPIDSSLVIPKGPQWLGAPLLPGGTTVTDEPDRRVIEYGMPYGQVFAWYKSALSRYPDARYRDWKDEMYIEDQGGSKWHAIKISKSGGAKTLVTLKKDSWTWIFSTLLIRFVGVFVVLLVLWVGLNIASAVLRRFVRGDESKTEAS
jgi:hypothetical protein